MPKNKKGKQKGRRGGDSRQPSDEEYDTGDNASVVSSVSDIQSLAPDGAAEEVDEISAQEQMEDKLKDVIDGLSQKSAKGRVECLKSLESALSKKYIDEFVTDRKLTISDGLERCIRKGKGEEQSLACTNVVLLCLQLGMGVESEELYTSMVHILRSLLLDGTASTKARSACATTLGLLTFICSGDLGQAKEIMTALESIFKGSYFKGDGSVPSLTPETCSLHTEALIAWSLLLSIAPPNVCKDLARTHMSKLIQILHSSDVDLRIASGEAIALMYEMIREEDEAYEGDNIIGLCEKLKQLATDGNRSRAKKDRRQQRSSFRDVLKAVEEYDAPYYEIKFGLESMHIDCWARKRQYDSLCHVLGTGMNVHLTENELVRDIFGLGAPIPRGSLPISKASKLERHMYNAAAFKARTLARAKNRDKRSDFGATVF